MQVVLYGASGTIGCRILEELVRRGHTVNAATRHPERIAAQAGVTPMQSDVRDAGSVAQTAKGCDAAIDAISPAEGNAYRLVDAAKSLVKTLPELGVRRLIVVGNAGTLEVSDGVLQMETPEFPEQWMGVAVAQRDVLKVLRGSDLDWSFFCPASMIQPGERTGKFRMGGSKMIYDGEGASRISIEDYAVALVDELERPQCVRKQCTVAY